MRDTREAESQIDRHPSLVSPLQSATNLNLACLFISSSEARMSEAEEGNSPLDPVISRMVKQIRYLTTIDAAA